VDLEVAEEDEDLRPFTSLLLQGPDQGEFLVRTEDYPIARMFLELPEVQAILPRAISLQFEWQPRAVAGQTYRALYVLQRDAFLTGDMLEDASANRDPQFNQPIVQFQLTRAGGRRFGDVTGRHVGDRIAIVLDREVVSAPVVRSRIGARGQIELGGLLHGGGPGPGAGPPGRCPSGPPPGHGGADRGALPGAGLHRPGADGRDHRPLPGGGWS
jgi:hypothetical protein